MQEDSTAREEAEQLRINCDALRRQLDAADEHSRFLEKAITVLQKDRAKWKQMYSVSEDERRKVVQERDELRTRIKAG